jgi:rfaE bifunctional protein nucleotidyltransferase chain/domain
VQASAGVDDGRVLGNMTRQFRAKALASVHEVADAIAGKRRAGATLVTTNGCFDVLHAGHVQYLYEAAALGGILVVGINRDDVVRRHKGPGRPLQGEGDRCRIVAALEMVDYTFIFGENDPRAFLEVLRPDIHVKGGDYNADEIIEKGIVEQHGGRVATVSFLAGRSTTNILSCCCGGRKS